MLRIAVYFFQIVVELTQQYLVGTQQLRVVIKGLLLASENLSLILGDANQARNGVIKSVNTAFKICHVRSPFDASLTPLRTLCHFPPCLLKFVFALSDEGRAL